LSTASAYSTPGSGPRIALPAWPGNRPLRDWQVEALSTLECHPGSSFLASATPAAGKTTFGLKVGGTPDAQ